ncbi:hypothetical protein KI387_001841, partial [Taxus chinensis]
IRMESFNPVDSQSQTEQEQPKLQLKRVSGKEIMKPGTKLYLPITVSENKSRKKSNSIQGKTFSPSADEIKYIQSLEIYKEYSRTLFQFHPDLFANVVTIGNMARCELTIMIGNFQDPAIIVLNKPPGLPVQGGTGIQKSLDVLAAAALKYDSMEAPRL